MLKTALLVLAGFIAAIGVAFWLQPSSTPSLGTEAAGPRAALEPSVARVSRELEPRGESPARDRESGRPGPPFVDRARHDGAATAKDRRLAVDLIVAGFAPERAERISRRALELRAEAYYESGREGLAPAADVYTVRLREELGDQDFERFLVAQGAPTSVTIMNVVARSLAERAGMQRGDEIFYYDGKRVFSVPELSELTLGGKRGPAVLDVRRDGQNFRIVLPHGPMAGWGVVALRAPPGGFAR